MPGEQWILGFIWPKKNHGYSISAKRYDFCPHLIKLDIFDITLSPIHTCTLENHVMPTPPLPTYLVMHCKFNWASQVNWECCSSFGLQTKQVDSCATCEFRFAESGRCPLFSVLLFGRTQIPTYLDQLKKVKLYNLFIK